MSPTPNDTNVSDSIPWLTALGGLCLFAARKWIAKINPWPWLQKAAGSLGEPLMQRHMVAVHARFDEGDKRMGRIEDGVERVQRVIDHMPGAAKAHEAVSAEDKAKARWGGQ